MPRPRPAPTNSAIVLGGGPTGLAAALALADADLAVTLIDAAPDAANDRRTAALMAASVTMLDRLGVWQSCRAAAAPLKRLRIIDDTGRLIRAPTVEFAAGEIGEEAFGWNIPHDALVPALREACTASPLIEPLHKRARAIVSHADRVVVQLDTGEELSAPLVVGADGRNSAARRAAGITAREWQYEQAAIVANLRHQRPHDHVSTEFHRSAGPFTLVPLPGERSSLVWVEKRAVAEALAGFALNDLSREVARLSRRMLGDIEIEGPIGLFALSGMTARRFGSRRIALVGEAAHVMPPIGAQGLNLGLRDAAMLAEVVANVARLGADPGSAAVTNAYDRARHLDVATRSAGVDLLNRSLLGGFLPFQAMRAAGLAALAGIAPLRRAVMREGVAPHFNLPQLMRREME